MIQQMSAQLYSQSSGRQTDTVFKKSVNDRAVTLPLRLSLRGVCCCGFSLRSSQRTLDATSLPFFPPSATSRSLLPRLTMSRYTMNLHSGRASVAMLRMMGCANGRSARHLLHSDCVVDEKTVVLQKKENEGFGFVLRGAKGRNVD
ncbi:hypothetical protein GOODEAATRI_027960 [Goodea atripinnis]|uniref:PDZ domain-containing protein n=1 Tax=Goodea atripinnis TaxID=208336 RepID=A0ABV0PSA9_9TELE